MYINILFVVILIILSILFYYNNFNELFTNTNGHFDEENYQENNYLNNNYEKNNEKNDKETDYNILTKESIDYINNFDFNINYNSVY